MNIVKFDRTEIKTPTYDPNPQKSTTNNHNWRQGMIIVLKNTKTGEEYHYMPKWNEIINFNACKEMVEELNKKILIKQQEVKT